MEKKEGTKAVSDREFLEILEQDPSRGMELLIGQYSGLLWSLVSRYLDNQEDQKDCINETFEQFYYNRKRFDPGRGSLSAYMAGMLQKRAVSLYRKNSVRKWEELSDSYPADESELDCLDWSLDLQQALEALKPEEFELIRMKYYEGMKGGAKERWRKQKKSKLTPISLITMPSITLQEVRTVRLW